MATYQELRAQIEKLAAEAEALRQHELQSVLAQMREKIAELGITVEDLFGRRRQARGPVLAKPREPKYHNPKTGETWSGRGRAPSWIGKNRERFLIQK
ncbi:H-NS histone family protein [Mycetohabitans endofungorum]|uniref:H-NS histone family protein n=1 Tax=Mycetohabitans endofungorum TaxID=417203 RepID=UPI002B056439|nr:H-NS histone family protein [Mycetohabitans endofungorum]